MLAFADLLNTAHFLDRKSLMGWVIRPSVRLSVCLSVCLFVCMSRLYYAALGESYVQRM
jgi:hypothetical protein